MVWENMTEDALAGNGEGIFLDSGKKNMVSSEL